MHVFKLHREHCVSLFLIKMLDGMIMTYNNHGGFKNEHLKYWFQNVDKRGNARNVKSNASGWHVCRRHDAIWDRLCQLKANVYATVPQFSGPMQTHLVQATPVWNAINMIATGSVRATGPHDLVWAAHGQQSGCNVRTSEESWLTNQNRIKRGLLNKYGQH